MGEYERRSEEWVRRHFPGSNPEPGSVEFAMDAAAYNSGAWAEFEVSWLDKQQHPGWPTPSVNTVTRTIDDHAWQYDATQLIRELLDMELPPEGGDEGVSEDRQQDGPV